MADEDGPEFRGHQPKRIRDFLHRKYASLPLYVSALIAVVLMGGCGAGYVPPAPVASGSVAVFGTDTPVCGVQSFVITITSASLVPQGGGQTVSLVSSATPATVDFGRLTDFTNLVSDGSVAPGQYSYLQISLANPQLTELNTANLPPTPLVSQPTLTTTSLLLPINPPLVVTSAATSGLTFDFDLNTSLQIGSNGQLTGTVIPQITLSSTSGSGSAAIGEASALYGIAGAPSIGSAPSGFTGSFPLALHDGTGQSVTVLVNGSTAFDGDGVSSLSQLTANDFVEVDAVVNASGQIVAQSVDVEEQTFSQSALLGKVLAVVRDNSGNATSFTLLINDEDPVLPHGFPQSNGTAGVVGTALNVNLTAGTSYFTNWGSWNHQAFTFGPQTLGVAENVAVFGTYEASPTFQFFANQVFLRPRSVEGNFRLLQAAGSDGVTGAFTMIPCGGLFGGQAITVLTYPESIFSGLSGLNALSGGPTINTLGVMMYQPTSGTSTTGGSWTAPTWVMQARQVHQLPN